MVSISESFPSKYVKAADLKGQNVVVVIGHVTFERISPSDNRDKPVVYFQGKSRGMVLNKTNATNIAHLFGDDTDDWAGREVVLYSAMVDFQGQTVEAIRVRGVRAADKSKGGLAPKPAAPLPQQHEPPPREDIGDEIPF
jgi:hypothetical protein